jgi:hypothetical protein
MAVSTLPSNVQLCLIVVDNILVIAVLSKRFWKELMLGASVTSLGRLFHTLFFSYRKTMFSHIFVYSYVDKKLTLV